MNFKNSIGAGAVLMMLVACTTNPITGRKSFQMVSNQEIASTAVSQYKETLSKSKVITGTNGAHQVKSVGERIKNAANQYYKTIGRAGDLTGLELSSLFLLES